MQEQTPPTPPTPPAPSQIGAATPLPSSQGATPAAIYEAFKAQRRELLGQLDNLENRREDLSERLEEPTVTGIDRKGIEQRIVEVDERISVIGKQIAESDARIALQAGVPGSVQPPLPPPRRDGPPEEF